MPVLDPRTDEAQHVETSEQHEEASEQVTV